MTETRSPWEPEPAPEAESRPATVPPAPPTAHDAEESGTGVELLRLPPLLPRRQNPWLLVEVDDSPGSHGALVWALREAARREATVVAVHVLDDPAGDPLEGSGRVHLRTRMAAHDRLEAHVIRAIGETGVQGRTRTAVLDRAVFEALSAAAQGADLVVVSGRGKALLRHAVPRPPTRRLARGA